MLMAKCIDELYEEIKHFDLVLCNDVALALALNNRLDAPRIGDFAITPRQLAREMAVEILGTPIMSDIEIVKFVSLSTGYPFRYVHGEIENFKTIRKYTSNVRKYLRSYKTREIYDEYVRLPTLDNAMGKFDGSTNEFFKGKKIAIIGEELYDNLDKNFIPSIGNFESINLFKRGNFVIPKFRELANDKQIAENIVDLITNDNARDIAIVLDVDGLIADSVRSELYRHEIPFINDLSMRDLSNVRDFLEFIRMSHNFEIIKLCQVRGLISAYGGKVNLRYDEYLIENFEEFVDNERAKELFSLMKNINNHTYGNVCEIVVKKHASQIKMLLSDFELTDTKVNQVDTNDIVYAVDNFELKHNEQIPINEKEGVLLLDCKKSVYVDRPVIFFIGLGSEWEKDLSDLNLIDTRLKDDIMEQNAIKFQILLQQGSVQVYVCNSVKNGKKPKPCNLFELSENSGTVIYNKFADIADCISGHWTTFKNSDLKISSIKPQTSSRQFMFSKSSFDCYMSCPRMFMYSHLIGSPETGDSALGTVIHEYAEFRVVCPKIVQENGREFFVKAISKRCLALFTPDLRTLKESKIRNSLKNIDEFVERYRLCDKATLIDKVRNGNKKNMFFDLFGISDKGSSINEINYVSSKHHMYGIYDVLDGKHIYDFKTGKLHGSSDVVKNMNLEKITNYPKEFQCLFYLSILEDKINENGTFTLFYTSGNECAAALGQPTNIEDSMVHVLIVNRFEFVRNNLFSLTMSGNSYRRLAERESEFFDIFAEIGYNTVIEDQNGTVEKVIKKLGFKGSTSDREMITRAVKKFSIMYTSDYQSFGNIVYIATDALEKFRNMVKRSYDIVMKDFYIGFKPEPKFECKHCNFRDVCTSEIIQKS